ncbi:MAG: hypothetical protein RLZZ136_979 [Pseudomonadota bacterium]|jgi:outer membrane receptor protein involved in Fe transport
MRCLMAFPALVFAVPALADAVPIVVLGRGLPDSPSVPAYDVTQLDRESLSRAASGRLEDALASVAGFAQFRRSDSRSSNPSAQGVTLRALGGNATSRTLVLLDGVPVADPFFGFVPLSALAPERLASARVTRGGGSGAFGAGAVAGTIELTSAGARELGLISASGLIDDRGDSELSATLAPHLGAGFAMVSARWDQGPGFWTTPQTQRVAASVPARYNSWSTGLRGVAPLVPDVEVQLRGLAFQDNRTLRFAGADTMAKGQDASLRLIGRGAWAFDVLAYGQLRDFSNVVISTATYHKTLDQYATPSTGFGGKFELRPPVGGDHVLRLGADWRIATGRSQEAAYNPSTGAITVRRQSGGHQSDRGLFIEDDWTLGAVVLTAGARADHWRQSAGFYHETSPAGVAIVTNNFANRSGWRGTFRTGAVVKAAGGISLRAAAYTGLRLPTLNELYRQFRVGTITTYANDRLGNEALRGAELGLDWTPAPGVSLSLTGFDDRVNQAIANVTLPSGDRRRMPVDAIQARGIELGLRGRTGEVYWDGALAWTKAKVVASGMASALNGMRPAQTPKLAASATLGWQPRSGWSLALTMRHVGAQYEDDLQANVLPAVTTVNAYAEMPLRRGLSLVLRGENLGDVAVVTLNQPPAIDLGAPRTLWAGVKVALP